MPHGPINLHGPEIGKPATKEQKELIFGTFAAGGGIRLSQDGCGKPPLIDNFNGIDGVVLGDHKMDRGCRWYPDPAISSGDPTAAELLNNECVINLGNTRFLTNSMANRNGAIMNLVLGDGPVGAPNRTQAQVHLMLRYLDNNNYWSTKLRTQSNADNDAIIFERDAGASVNRLVESIQSFVDILDTLVLTVTDDIEDVITWHILDAITLEEYTGTFTGDSNNDAKAVGFQHFTAEPEYVTRTRLTKFQTTQMN